MSGAVARVEGPDIRKVRSRCLGWLLPACHKAIGWLLTQAFRPAS